MNGKNWKQYVPIIVIVLVAIFFRFAYLGQIPNAVGGDELHYAITAKAVMQTGRDITGTWNPWSLVFFRYPPNEQQAELPYLLHLLFSAPFPFSLLMFKLPFALLGVGTVVLLYAIAGLLFGLGAAIATGAIAAINPWLVVMDRTGYETAPATFFYLLALYLLLKSRRWNILLAFIPLALAFYSYIATKVIFVPFVVVASLLAYYKQKKQYAKQYLILCGLSVLVVGVFFLLLKTNPNVSRLGDLFLPTSPEVVTRVNEVRATAIRSPLLPLIANRYMVFVQMAVSKLFRIFSPTYLFVEGDQFFFPGRQSFFYYLDALFLFLGALSVFNKKTFYAWITCAFIALGSLPQLVSTTTGDFSIHLTLMFPFMLILIGSGIADVVGNVPKRLFVPVLYGIALLYAVNVASFSVTYFSQYPLSGDADFPMRVLTKYLQLAKAKNIQVAVYATSPGDLFQKYIYYSDSITGKNMPALSSQIFASSIAFGGVRFLQCDTLEKGGATGSTAIFDRGCGVKIEKSRTSITNLADGGEIYIILGDTVCLQYPLKRFARGVSIGDFSIENLQEKHFCETYISIR